jgi:hypothetical protein
MKLGMAYYGAYLPEHLRSDFGAMADIGCDEVLLTLAENDFRIMTGKVKFAPDIAHDLGLRLIANLWGFACAFGGGRVSRLLTDNPDVWLMRRDGTRVGEGCTNHPALRQRAREMVEQCAGLGYDGFFWDEPTVQDCYCPHCAERFAATHAGALLEADAAGVMAFRQESIASYVEGMSDFVKGLDARFETATCVMPTDQAAWDVTAAIRSLDTFGTDPYWLCFRQPTSWVTPTTQAAMEVSRRYGKRSLMWLQGWAIPAGCEDEIADAGQRIAAEQPDALYTWAFRAAQGTVETSVDALRAWDVITRVYRDLAGR